MSGSTRSRRSARPISSPNSPSPIPVAVIADLLGVPREMGPQLVDWSHRMVAMYQFGVTRAVEDRAAEAARAFADYVRGFARARRGDLGDDLVSQLLIAESDGGKLSEDELVATVILLLNAGHEATVQAIGNGVKIMLEQGVDARRGVRQRKRDPSDGRGIAAARPAAASLRPLRAGRGRVRRRASAEGREDRPSARRRQPRSRALSRARRVSTPAGRRIRM